MSIGESYDSLDAALSGDEPDWDAEPEAPLGAEHADRLLRRLGRVQRKAAEVAEIARIERDRIDAWLAGEQLELDRQREWLVAALAQYHRAVLDRDPKATSIRLPFGSLKARKQQPEWRITDRDQLMAWIEQNEFTGLLRQPPIPALEIDRAALKSLATTDGLVVTEDGVVVPGVQVVKRDRTFVAEPSA